MREILFRGKDIKGNWHIGLLAHIGNAWYILSDKAGVATAFEVIPETVGQYIGIPDKNDKKIFEGDILLIKTTLESINKETRNDEYTANGVVVFNEGHFELEGEGLVLCTYWGLKSLFVAAHFKEYEVIGNIHDNPELLKGGAKE